MTTPENEPLLISIYQAARRIGLAQSTIVRLIDEGEIPCVHVGSRRLVKYDQLLECVERLRE